MRWLFSFLPAIFQVLSAFLAAFARHPDHRKKLHGCLLRRGPCPHSNPPFRRQRWTAAFWYQSGRGIACRFYRNSGQAASVDRAEWRTAWCAPAVTVRCSPRALSRPFPDNGRSCPAFVVHSRSIAIAPFVKSSVLLGGTFPVSKPSALVRPSM